MTKCTWCPAEATTTYVEEPCCDSCRKVQSEALSRIARMSAPVTVRSLAIPVEDDDS